VDRSWFLFDIAVRRGYLLLAGFGRSVPAKAAPSLDDFILEFLRLLFVESLWDRARPMGKPPSSFQYESVS
jgi:hypothetical protein